MTAPTSETAPSRPRCAALNAEGAPCGQDTVSAATGYCLFHDPSRIEEAAEARVKGGVQQGANKRAAKAPRTVAPDDLPGPLESLQDCVRWSSWVARSVASGVLDKFSAHETILAIGSLRQSLKERDYLAEIRALQAELAKYKTGAQ